VLVNVGGVEQAVDGDDPTFDWAMGRFLTWLFLSFLLTTNIRRQLHTSGAGRVVIGEHLYW